MTIQQLQAHRLQRVRSNRSVHGLKQALLLGLVLPFLLAFLQPAHAQVDSVHLAKADTTVPTTEVTAERPTKGFAIPSSTWHANFDAQAARLLRGNYADAVQDAVLQDVIIVATQSPNAIDLSSTVGALLQIVESDAEETRRLMAIQALHTIGTEHANGRIYRRAMTQLHQMIEEGASERVRGAAATALAAVQTSSDEAQ